jgi:BirA family biotin operon repressor/biotin-[acetyl-CoA-carboxylase] ligase
MENYIGKKRYTYPALDSTNNCANELIGNIDIPEGTLVVTTDQSKGRGQGNTKWDSQPGKNLTFSVVLKPHFLTPEDQFMLSKTISLGIADHLSKNVSTISIKWPNDIYSGDKKLGGILIETIIQHNLLRWCIAGIGINVNQIDFPEWIPNPTSLRLLNDRPFDLQGLLTGICSEIETRYEQLRSGDREGINHDYHSMLYKAGMPATFIVDGQSFDGEIKEVKTDGKLVLKVGPDRLLGFYQHEIDFVR